MPYPATPRTWVAGDVLTAAQLNAELRDALLGAFPLAVDAWTGFTPTLTQPGAITKTVNYAKYQRVGRLIVAQYSLSVTAAGTAANPVLIGLPVACAHAVAIAIGSVMIYDASAPFRYNGTAELVTASTFQCSYNMAAPTGWGTDPTIALASGDVIRASVMFEAAT